MLHFIVHYLVEVYLIILVCITLMVICFCVFDPVHRLYNIGHVLWPLMINSDSTRGFLSDHFTVVLRFKADFGTSTILVI